MLLPRRAMHLPRDPKPWSKHGGFVGKKPRFESHAGITSMERITGKSEVVNAHSATACATCSNFSMVQSVKPLGNGVVRDRTQEF
eukprot:4148651-Prymnesium_polylepis.1